MSVSPENIIRKIGNTIEWIKKHPHTVASNASMVAGVVTLFWVSQAWQEDPNIVTERKEKEKLAKEATQEALIKDYEKTDGVDMDRLSDTDSFLFTISRPSAVLAGSTEEILGKVIMKVAKETGCPSIITSVVWEDRSFRMPWITPKPTIYSATAVCPK